jgi:hypothetical protein
MSQILRGAILPNRKSNVLSFKLPNCILNYILGHTVNKTQYWNQKHLTSLACQEHTGQRTSFIPDHMSVYKQSHDLLHAKTQWWA